MFRCKGFLFSSLVVLALIAGACSAITSAPTPTPEPTATPPPTPLPARRDPADTPPPGAGRQFKTDFSKHSVPYNQIISGGPPKDGIPAVDHPVAVSIAEADAWLDDREPVILIQLGGEARAYPLQILMWHEIANDTVGGHPVTVTYCPLCNTGIAFDRTFNGQVLDFGTTGRLRYSNLIMYDRQTESWWQQATGEAIAGEFTGGRLTFIPAPVISWADFKANFPNGTVLSRETGHQRPYGTNPYTYYDELFPFLYSGPISDTLPTMAYVLTIDLGGQPVSYPYGVLQKERVVNDQVDDLPIAVFWTSGTASAMNSDIIALGRDIGSAHAYARVLDGRTLTFRYEDSHIVDKETGSVWNILGQAVSGELAGRQLAPVISINHFWFSWAAFKPNTRVYIPPP